MISTTAIEIKILKPVLNTLPVKTHAWHFLGIERIRRCIRTYVFLSILPAMLLPVADVSLAADDAFLPCYLTNPTHVQFDSDRMKTPDMETC